MKVAHFSFGDTIGASGAAYELHNCMRENGVDSTFFVRTKSRKDNSVIELRYCDSKEERIWRTIGLLYFELNQSPDSLGCHLDEVGISWTKELEKQLERYDVFHLHWITGLLSIDNLMHLLNMGKCIVWTMHDFHPFTAVCHCPLTCSLYKKRCNECPQLIEQQNEMVHLEWKRKKLICKQDICIIAASNWLKKEINESVLFRNNICKKIPIGINENIFSIKDKKRVREKWGFGNDDKIILIGAQNVNAALKGYTDISVIIENLKNNKHCKRLLNQGKLKLVLFGRGTENFTVDSIPIVKIGFIKERNKLCDLYNASDVFIFPSKQETFGMTAAEAMFCGTPVVAYDICAMKEVIYDGVNGYRAKYLDFKEMSHYIIKILENEYFDREACRQYMLGQYTLQKETEKVLHVYKEQLGQKVYKKSTFLEDNEDNKIIKLSNTYFEKIKKQKAINQNRNLEVPAIFDKYNPVFMSPERKIFTLKSEKKIKKDTSIFIFGAGNIGKKTCEILEMQGIRIKEFWDNDKEKTGNCIKGYYVNLPYKRQFDSSSCILIASDAYIDIASQLCDLGYIPNQNFY